VHEQNGRIFWMEVSSPMFRTADPIGVGSPLGRLLERDGLSGGVGDCADADGLNATNGPACGLVFWLDSQTAKAISEIAHLNPDSHNGRPTGLVLDALRPFPLFG
jgi:hypothetical protein